MELTKVPTPVPSLVFVLRAVVGFETVLQHTPRAVTGDPPSVITVPPPVTVVDKTLVKLEETRFGGIEVVVVVN
jgi:hypothetical protein